MRGLFLTPDWPWPPTTGGLNRAKSIADGLRELGEVEVLAANHSTGAPEGWGVAAEAAMERRRSRRERGRDAAAALLTARHITLERWIAAGLHAAFENILEQAPPSYVVLGRGFGGPFITAARNANVPVFLEADERIAAVSRSVLKSPATAKVRARAAFDLMSAGRAEGRDFLAADEVWFSTPYEAARAGRRTRTRVVPNVAPPRRFEPPGEVAAVGFVGYFRHPPNDLAAVELLTSIMPVLRSLGGPRRLILIGREPTLRMRRLAARDPEVMITGEVDDVAPLLRGAGVLLMPIRSGGGSRIKALEAAALGVPIVSTEFGVAGLGFVPDRDYLRSETAAGLARQVRRLQESAELRLTIATSARRMVDRNHSKSSVTRSLRAAMDERLGSTHEWDQRRT